MTAICGLNICLYRRDRNSGLGDHGPSGIKLFAEQHQCNDICKQLQLQKTTASVENFLGELDAAQVMDESRKVSVSGM